MTSRFEHERRYQKLLEFFLRDVRETLNYMRRERNYWRSVALFNPEVIVINPGLDTECTIRARP